MNIINLSRFSLLLSYFVLLAWTITACEADSATPIASPSTNTAAKKRELIKLMRGLRLEPVRGTTNPLCQAFLEDFRQQQNVEHIIPAVQTDSYDDPRLAPYRKRCPELDLHKTLVPIGAAPHKVQLPPGKEGNEKYYKAYLDTRNLQLYELEMDDNPATGKEIIFYGEAPKLVRSGGVPFPKGPTLTHRGRYRTISLNSCSELGAMSVGELGGSSDNPTESHGVIRYSGKIALYDLTVFKVLIYADGSRHGPYASLLLNHWKNNGEGNSDVGQVCNIKTPRK